MEAMPTSAKQLAHAACYLVGAQQQQTAMGAVTAAEGISEECHTSFIKRLAKRRNKLLKQAEDLINKTAEARDMPRPHVERIAKEAACGILSISPYVTIEYKDDRTDGLPRLVGPGHNLIVKQCAKALEDLLEEADDEHARDLHPGTMITTLDVLTALPVGARVADKYGEIWDRQNADGGGADWIDADTIAVVGAKWLLGRVPLIYVGTFQD